VPNILFVVNKVLFLSRILSFVSGYSRETITCSREFMIISSKQWFQVIPLVYKKTMPMLLPVLWVAHRSYLIRYTKYCRGPSQYGLRQKKNNMETSISFLVPIHVWKASLSSLKILLRPVYQFTFAILLRFLNDRWRVLGLFKALSRNCCTRM